MKKPASSVGKASRAKAAATAPPAGPAAAAAVLTAEAWAEADLALAEALIAQTRVEAGLTALCRKLARRKDDTLNQAADALDGETLLLAQGLLRAAKARGLSLFGETGAVAPFDPKRHRPVKGVVEKAAAVKITAPGVTLGRQVLIPAEVKRLRTAKAKALPKGAKAASPPPSASRRKPRA